VDFERSRRKGRIADMKPISNPQNRFTAQTYEWLDVPPEATLEVYEEQAKSIISENDSPDVGFRYSVNPYRGCFHACAYCYARPTHQYIDFGAGTDFERKIVAKKNAPELLREAFEKKSWQGETIVFSGVTDCYQPLELSHELTKRCLEVCLEYRNPVGIITKGVVIERDIPLLVELSKVTTVKVYASIAFADDLMSKAIEPSAPRPSRRFKAMKLLHENGIDVGLGIAPVIPSLNDIDIPEILERGKEAGATTAFLTLLRLPAETAKVFTERLESALPSKAKKVLSQIQQMRGGKLNNSEFGSRMRGRGEQWKSIEWLFDSQCKKLGLNLQRNGEKRPPIKTFKRPSPQLELPLG
jgi:DNA repair photolyase